jgi:ketosteroid isomerase-like protein
VNGFSDSAMSSVVSSIVALREAWLAAVKAGDANRLAAIVTDDVVIVHGKDRCVCGRENVKPDFLKEFQRYAIDQKVSSTEVTVRGKWAFEIGEVVSPLQGSEPIDARSKTVVVLAQQSARSGLRLPWQTGTTKRRAIAVVLKRIPLRHETTAMPQAGRKRTGSLGRPDL